MLIHQVLSLNNCDIKFASAEGAFSGYGSVFGNVDSKSDIVMPGAYAEVLKSADRLPVYVNHNWRNNALPIGYWEDLKEDDRGLFGNATLIMQMPSAIDAYWGMKSGLVTGLSVAILPNPGAIERRADGVRVIHSVKALKEISIVTDPANDLTRVTDVKTADELAQVQTVRDFERLLRDAGAFDQATAKAIVSKAKELFAQREAGDEKKAELTNDELLFVFRNYL